jgi:hypothetical protein
VTLLPITGDWKTTVTGGDRVPWLPLVAAGAGGQKLGLARTREWLIGDERRCVAAFAGAPVLPLLEREPHRLLDELRQALDRAGLPVELAGSFPLETCIVAGLESGMPYWADLALDWIAALGVTAALAAPLEASTRAVWASQAIRHRARRLLASAPGGE